MRFIKKGFSAVELLIAMVIALVFLISGYQVYQFIVKTSGSARLEADANSIAKTYLDSYSASATNPCTAQSFSSTAVTLSNGSQASVSGSISCNTIYTPGLIATYYNNKTLSAPYAIQKAESNVNHDWALSAPNPAVVTDGFSVTWSGYVTPTKTGTYTFYGTSDDGEVLSVNGTQLINEWVDQPATTWSGTVALTAGQPVPISYSMYDGSGLASAVLEWATPDGQRSVIPASALSHAKTVSKVNATVQYGSSKKAYATTMADSNACQSGFIKVPGSKTYNTTDFCVMKYEAKIYGNDNGSQTYSQSNIPSSRASGTPYVNISQNDAAAQAKKTVDQSGNIVVGAHLITEAEWMTIAQNVLGQIPNWSGGAIGSGFIYDGHVNNSPSALLSASTDDTQGNYGETAYDNSSSANINNKRTLVLSNGQTIWDMSGNAWEWTAGQITSGQPGATGDTGYNWHEWNVITQNGFPSASMPNSTGITGISGWNNSKGIGSADSYYGETVLRGFLRSGAWDCGSYAGILAAYFNFSPSTAGVNVGFRVAYTLPATSP